jgi:NAD(P)H-flavin reductase
MSCPKPTSWIWIIGPYSLLFLERVFRFVRIRRKTAVISVIAHPSKVLEFQFKKPSMHFQQGQYIYLNVPFVSYYQWHPFTVTSIPQEGIISVHMRICGDWTDKVSKAFGVEFLSDGTICYLEQFGEPKVFIDGPFGDICRRVGYYRWLLLIGAGIGQTPFASVLKSVW